MNQRRLVVSFTCAACLMHAAQVFAQAPVTDTRALDERLKRMERLFESGTLLKLFEEVESLGTEVRELRGQLEEQSHAISDSKRQQRELRLDLDRWVQRIESAPAQTTSASSPPAAVPVTPQAPVATTAPDRSTDPAGAILTADIDPLEEQQAYQGAFDLLKSQRYEEAGVAFQQFIVRYPTGQYADNAQYWLGETHYITRKFELAIQDFQRLVSIYPNSQKLTHALLKIGYVHDELGNKAQAEQVLDDLVARYPQSTAANLARKRLQRIRGR